MAKKTILVNGATGRQGGSVARHLLRDGNFAVRALTRNPESEKALELKSLKAEIVQGDHDNIESLKNSLKGCYGAFGITSFWEHFEKEYEQGKNLVDAVASSNIEHFVFGSLPYAHKISDGRYEVPHFDIKGKLVEYINSLGLKTTILLTTFYYENFLSVFRPQKQEDGTYAFGFPQGDTKLATFSVEDLGGIVTTIFNNPDKFIGRTVGTVGEDQPPAKYAEIMSKTLGKKVVYNHIPREIFIGFGFPRAEDLANMFEFNRYYLENRQKDLDESRQLYPGMQSFKEWMESNKEKFPI